MRMAPSVQQITWTKPDPHIRSFCRRQARVVTNLMAALMIFTGEAASSTLALLDCTVTSEKHDCRCSPSRPGCRTA